MTFILHRFQTRYVLGPTMILWAIVCASTAGVTTWQGLFVQRFFLGSPPILLLLFICFFVCDNDANSIRFHGVDNSHMLHGHC